MKRQLVYHPSDKTPAELMKHASHHLRHMDPAIPLEFVSFSPEEWAFRKRFLLVAVMLHAVRPATLERVRAMAVEAVPEWLREHVRTDFFGVIEGIACEAPHRFLREAYRIAMEHFGPRTKAELTKMRKQIKMERDPVRRRGMKALLRLVQRQAEKFRKVY